MNPFSHLDEDNRARMVNVAEKATTLRTARAVGKLLLPQEVLRHFEGGELRTKKGAVFQTAIIAGIMAAKKTGELIPLCHPLSLEDCQVNIQLEGNEVRIECTSTITGKTGVEMEALTGVTIAALTVYDMCKALSHQIEIREIKLVEKTGGKHDISGQ